eukprot:1519653-Amphidinium_carterae.1
MASAPKVPWRPGVAPPPPPVSVPVYPNVMPPPPAAIPLMLPPPAAIPLMLPPPAAAPLMLPPPAATPLMLPPPAAIPLMLPPPPPGRRAIYPTTHAPPQFHGGKAMQSADQRGQSSTSTWRGNGGSQSSTSTWHGRGAPDPPSPARTNMSQVVKTPPPPLSVALAGGGFRRVPSPPK